MKIQEDSHATQIVKYST